MKSATLGHAETVKRLAKNGMSQREIAAMTDLSLSTVNRLVNYDAVTDSPGSLEAFASRNCGQDDDCPMCILLRGLRKTA